MDLIDRIRKLENEFKLLKNEIHNTLLDIRDSLDRDGHLFSPPPPFDVARPRDEGKAGPHADVPRPHDREVPPEGPQRAQPRTLRFHKLHSEGANASLVVQLLDDDNNVYQWAPRSNEVERIFLHSIDAEQSSKSESDDLAILANTSGREQRTENAKTLKGYFEYEDNKLVVSLWGDRGEERLKPAFFVASGFFDKWLENDAEAFVTRGYAVRISRLDHDGRVIEVYPPKRGEQSSQPR